MYTPDLVWEPAPGLEEALAQQAIERGLVVVAGAGISAAEPTGLPSGGGTAELLVERLHLLGKEQLVAHCDPRDLLCVADAIEAQAGGGDLLQGMLRQAAAWLTATPDFGHKALAVLVAEGLVHLVLTNWDDCVERSLQLSPRINAVINDADRAHVTPPRVLKVHGCATRYGSLLATTGALEEPPTWAFHELGASLGTAPVVFIGVGSLASYTRQRVVQVVAAVPEPEWIYVVARTIGDDWHEIIPALGEDHVAEQDADAFLDSLLRAVVRMVFMIAREKATAMGDEATAGIESVAQGLGFLGALDVVMWFRASLVEWPPATRGLTGAEGMRALLALCMLSSGAPVDFVAPAALVLDQHLYCVLLSRNAHAYDVIKQSQARAAQLAAQGLVRAGDSLKAVSIGHIGAFRGGGAPRDIVAEAEPDSVVDGPLGTTIEYISGDALVAEVA